MRILESLEIWSVLSLVVLTIAFIATKVARKSAAIRHTIWMSAFAALLAIPAACQIMPGRVIPQPVADAVSYEVVEIATATTAVTVAKPFDWQPILSLAVNLWVGGMLLFAAFIIRAYFQARKMKRTSVATNPTELGCLDLPSKSGVDKKWELRVSLTRRPPAAMTWGWMKPIVMLPKDSSTWSNEKCETVLLHELAHVRRNDSLSQFFALVVCTVYWFNPLVWLAAKAMRAEAEKAADDRVILAGVKPSDYADALLRIATEFGHQRQPMTNIGVSIMKQSKIESRILSIVDPTRRRRGVARIEGLSIASVALVSVFAMAALRPTPAIAQEPAQASQDKTTNDNIDLIVNQSGSGLDIVTRDKVQLDPDQKVIANQGKKVKAAKKPTRIWTRVKRNGKYHYVEITPSNASKYRVELQRSQDENALYEAVVRRQIMDETRRKNARVDLNVTQDRLAEAEKELAEARARQETTKELRNATGDQKRRAEMELTIANKMAQRLSTDKVKLTSNLKEKIRLELEYSKQGTLDKIKLSVDQKRQAEKEMSEAIRLRLEQRLKTLAEKRALDEKSDENVRARQKLDETKKRSDEQKEKDKKGGGDQTAARIDSVAAFSPNISVSQKPITVTFQRAEPAKVRSTTVSNVTYSVNLAKVQDAKTNTSFTTTLTTQEPKATAYTTTAKQTGSTVPFSVVTTTGKQVGVQYIKAATNITTSGFTVETPAQNSVTFTTKPAARYSFEAAKVQGTPVEVRYEVAGQKPMTYKYLTLKPVQAMRARYVVKKSGKACKVRSVKGKTYKVRINSVKPIQLKPAKSK